MTEQNSDTLSTRERILDAAMNIFSAKGFHDTKLDEIVAEASISKGSIYFHFPNKEKLFIALVDQFADLIERRAKEAIEHEAQGIRRVQVALEAVLETFGKYRRPAKLLLVQAVGLGTVFERKRMEVNDRFALLIKTYLDESCGRWFCRASQYDNRGACLDGGNLQRGDSMGVYRRATVKTR